MNLTRYTITHAGPSVYDCWCEHRTSELCQDGVYRTTLTDTVEARSLTEARRGVDPRCAVELATAAEPQRVAA